MDEEDIQKLIQEGAIAFIPDQFSEDPMNNYLQFLFSSSVNCGVGEIYFYVVKEGPFALRRRLRIERSIPRQYVRVFSHITFQGEMIHKKDCNTICPWRVIEEPPLVGRKWVRGLERELRRIYQIKDLRDFDRQSFSREIKVNGEKVNTSLRGVCSTSDRSKGYCVELKYGPRNLD